MADAQVIEPSCAAKERRCENCSKTLVQRDDERVYEWRRRRFCGRSCARQFGPRRPLATKMARYTDTSLGQGPHGTCHIWTGCRSADGYGTLTHQGGTKLAHRLAFEMNGGRDFDGLLVCHSCDTPSCVNPDHLFLGTVSDNMADMTAKGRQRCPKGEEHLKSKLTSDQVRAIRQDDRIFRVIAADYGVTRTLIGLIKRRSVWRHVD